MNDEEILLNQHCWAILDGKLVVTMKCAEGYTLCGAWECCLDFSEFDKIISTIDPPKNHENTALYFAY